MDTKKKYKRDIRNQYVKLSLSKNEIMKIRRLLEVPIQNSCLAKNIRDYLLAEYEKKNNNADK